MKLELTFAALLKITYVRTEIMGLLAGLIKDAREAEEEGAAEVN